MAENATINIVLNTELANKNSDKLNQSIGKIEKSTSNLKTQLRQMTQELQGLEPGTKRFNDLSVAAGKLKDQISDTNAVIKATAGSATENLAKGLTNVASVGISGFQGLASATALFGADSEAVTETLVKLQALAGLGDAVKSLGALGDTMTEIKASFMAAATQLGIFTTAKEVDTVVTEGQTIATEGATVATNVLGKSMNALPIFAIIAGIAALVAAIVYLSSQTEDAVITQEDFNEVSSQTGKGLADAKKNVDEVGLAFRNAAKGVGSKKDALKLFNEKFGESLGIAKNYNEAERIFNKNADVYIKVSGLKAKADAFRALSAKTSADAFVAAQQLELSTLDIVELAKTRILKGDKAAAKEGRQIIINNMKESQKEFDARIAALDAQANKYSTEATKLESTLVTIKEEGDTKKVKSEKKTTDELMKIAKKLSDDEEIYYAATEEEKLTILYNRQKAEIESENKLAGDSEKSRDIMNAALVDLEEKLKNDINDIVTKREQDKLKIQEDAIKEAEKLAKQHAIDDANIVQDGLDRANDLGKSAREKELQESSDYWFEKVETAKTIYGEGSDEYLKLVTAQASEEERIKSQYDKEDEDRVKESNKRKLESIKSLSQDALSILSGTLSGSFDQILQGFAALQDKLFGDDGLFSRLQEGSLTTMQAIQVGVETTAAALQQLSNNQLTKTQDNISKVYETDKEKLDNQLADRVISENEYQVRISRIKQNADEKERIAKQKAFEDSKKLALVNAGIQTAQAVLAAFASGSAVPLIGPVTTAPIYAGIAAALGAAQIGIIASQEFRAARGGVVPGNGPSNIDSVPSLLAPGEMVINAKSAAMFPDVLSEINKAGGGISLSPSVYSSISNAINRNVDSGNGGSQNISVSVDAAVYETGISKATERINRIKRNKEFFGSKK